VSPVTTELAPVDGAYAHVLQRQLVTSVGVAPGLLKELTDHDVACLLTYSGTLEDMSKWVVSDLLVWAEEQVAAQVGARSGREFWDKRDAMWDDLLKLCKADISKHTAYNMAATARAFGWERRRHTATLSFEHHRLVSGRNPDEQEYWLDMTEAGEWSVARLRGALYGEGEHFTPNLTVMSTPEFWPPERVEREVYAAFGLPTRYDTVEHIKRLVEQIKGDLQREYQNHRSSRRYPRPSED
jgi:hypothetical protein